MNPGIDASRFPRTAAYVASLPHGIESFPDCLINADVLKDVRRDFPALARETPLPARLVALLTGTNTVSWVTESVAGALYLMVRDTQVPDDRAFLDWNKQNVARLFSGPLYRAIMLVLSPSLVLMGASRRWSTFHRGTSFNAEPVHRRDSTMVCHATLQFPGGLFTDLLLNQHCTTFLAALESSRAQNPSVDVVLEKPGVARYSATWDA